MAPKAPKTNKPDAGVPANAGAAAAAGEESRTLQVEATQTGFYAHIRRRPGAQFPITLTPGQKLPSWVKELGDETTAPAPAAATEPAGSGGPSTSVI